MDSRLKRLINQIGDKELREKVYDLFNDPSVKIEGETYAGLSFQESPAGISRHHSYPSGLLEHTLSTVKIALAMCNSVENIYQGKVNRDLIISGILLHDIFKPLTYNIKENGTYGDSPLGERINHLTLGVSELTRRGFPLDLIHIVCSHHGEAGPMTPKTVEALICNLADIADSRLNGEVMRAARYLVKDATGEALEIKDSKTAFKIVHSKTTGGWDGLRKTIEKMQHDSVNVDKDENEPS